ncbi:MAG TPA: DUF4097 family beta strand repeat-containing protein [Bacteroidota bacterium]|nr:DUF4097 family beta strand repeat-containing protein [Bacteroidota bacterium]
MKNLFLFAALAIVTVVAVHSGEKTFDQSFPVSAGGTLNLKTDLGSVEIVGVEGGTEASIHAIVQGRQRDVDEFEITAKATPMGVEVVGRSPRARRWWSSGTNDLTASFVVKVPAYYNITVQTAGGNLTIKDIRGKIEGGTSGGDITLHTVNGTVELKTSGGNVHAEKIEGMAKLGTSGGNVRITRARGDIDVTTSGGNIALAEIEGKVRAETSGGDIVVRLKDAYKGISARTSGGNIDITVPPALAATIDAETSGGEVSCDLPVTMSGKLSENRVRGTVNGGGPTLYARASGGNVRIHAEPK